MSYITTAEATAFLFPRGSAPTDLNTFIAAELSTVDEIINKKCNRNFNKSTSETRYYDGTGEDYVFTDDLVTVSKVEYFNGSWVEITDYYTLGSPIYKIVLLNGCFPSEKRSIRITGIWGWDAVPTVIKNVAKQIIAKLLLRGEQFRTIYYKDYLASEGIPMPQPSTEIWDEQLESLIDPYVRKIEHQY